MHQLTDREGLQALFATPQAVYIGFDCTANSLHVGSLVQIMILRMLQQHGHKPLVLLGGATTKVGDPSGKDEARKMLTDPEIEANKQGIKALLSRFIRFGEGKSDALLLDNAEWLSGLGYIDFLRDIGPHFSINRMLTMDSVKLRLEREQNLSFLEFNYMLLQAYDFVELHKRYNCRVEIGGSDQWGNIISGVELNRRLGQKEVFGLTTPLITTASGAKMGKTASGAVWLDAERVSPYAYFQFWRNTEDQDVVRFLKLFTELPMVQINDLATLKDAEINEAKKILAFEATRIAHGEEEAIKALETAQQTFEQGGVGDDLPTITLPEQELKDGVPFFALLHRAGLADSGGAARRVVRGGGGRINDERCDDENRLITLSDLTDGHIKLSSGKKNHALVLVA